MLEFVVRDEYQELKKLSQELRLAEHPRVALEKLQVYEAIDCGTSWQVLCDLIMANRAEGKGLEKDETNKREGQEAQELVMWGKLLPAPILTRETARLSKRDFALFGEEACRGANIIANGFRDSIHSFEVDSFRHSYTDQTKSEAQVLLTAQAVVDGFDQAVRDLGLDKFWERHRCGRIMDLETVGHSLGRFVGRFEQMLQSAVNEIRGKGAQGRNLAYLPAQNRHAWCPNPSTEAEWWDIVKSGQLE